MATKEQFQKAVDDFLSSVKIADLPGNYNPMVVLNKTRYGKAKTLLKTKISDLPTPILRTLEEDREFQRAFEAAKGRAFSALFRSQQNAESKDRKASVKRLRKSKSKTKKKAS